MFAERIEKEELKALPVKSFEGEIIIIDDAKDLEEYIPYLFKQTVIGFDTETRPSFKKGKLNPVALMQLSTDEYAFLIRLNKTEMPEPVKRILNDDQIVKAGVAISNDISGLRRSFDIEPANFIDLQVYTEDFDILDNALTKLCGIILNFNISKSQRISNWENEELTDAQKRYAATDAWVCFEIYNKLEKYETAI